MPWRWKWLGYIAMLTHVMKEVIAYETWHGVMWLDGEDQDKAWCRWTSCKCEGKVGGFRVMHHKWRRSLSEDLAPIDKGNSEGQVMSRSMNQ
jgi:hypothetical protein